MKILEQIRQNKPLILNLTNSVTVNDVANAILAVGGSPLMSNETSEMHDLIHLCAGVNLNIGTADKKQVQFMCKAGKLAGKLGKPVVFDPVGSGASDFRTKSALKIIKKVHPAVIKGNMSEIKALAGTSQSSSTCGVDVNPGDVIGEKNLEAAVNFVVQFAAKLKCVIAVTGAIDLVSDGKHCFIIRNGHEMMEKVCGTGCVISGILPCFICNAKNIEETARLTAECISLMGLAGEIAVKDLKKNGNISLENQFIGGNLTLRQKIIDNLFLLDDEKLLEGQKVELR